MTKQGLFRYAHAVARNLTGDYKARFAYGLKKAWAKFRKEAGSIVVAFVRETARAVAFKVWEEHTDTFKLAWCPKSLLNNNAIPNWFLNKKLDEINRDYQGSWDL